MSSSRRAHQIIISNSSNSNSSSSSNSNNTTIANTIYASSTNTFPAADTTSSVLLSVGDVSCSSSSSSYCAPYSPIATATLAVVATTDGTLKTESTTTVNDNVIDDELIMTASQQLASKKNALQRMLSPVASNSNNTFPSIMFNNSDQIIDLEKCNNDDIEEDLNLFKEIRTADQAHKDTEYRVHMSSGNNNNELHQHIANKDQQQQYLTNLKIINNPNKLLLIGKGKRMPMKSNENDRNSTYLLGHKRQRKLQNDNDNENVGTTTATATSSSSFALEQTSRRKVLNEALLNAQSFLNSNSSKHMIIDENADNLEFTDTKTDINGYYDICFDNILQSSNAKISNIEDKGKLLAADGIVQKSLLTEMNTTNIIDTPQHHTDTQQQQQRYESENVEESLIASLSPYEFTFNEMGQLLISDPIFQNEGPSTQTVDVQQKTSGCVPNHKLISPILANNDNIDTDIVDVDQFIESSESKQQQYDVFAQQQLLPNLSASTADLAASLSVNYGSAQATILAAVKPEQIKSENINATEIMLNERIGKIKKIENDEKEAVTSIVNGVNFAADDPAANNKNKINVKLLAELDHWTDKMSEYKDSNEQNGDYGGDLEMDTDVLEENILNSDINRLYDLYFGNRLTHEMTKYENKSSWPVVPQQQQTEQNTQDQYQIIMTDYGNPVHIHVPPPFTKVNKESGGNIFNASTSVTNGNSGHNHNSGDSDDLNMYSSLPKPLTMNRFNLGKTKSGSALRLKILSARESNLSNQTYSYSSISNNLNKYTFNSNSSSTGSNSNANNNNTTNQEFSIVGNASTVAVLRLEQNGDAGGYDTDGRIRKNGKLF